ncbi:MAG: ATP-binding protein, partial [Alphaproteobacteria bacterium]
MELIALAAGVAAALIVCLVAITARLLRDNAALRRKTIALDETVEGLSGRVAQLTESEERHRRLVDGQGDLIVQRDEQGRIVFANDAYAGLMGALARDIIGATRSHTVEERGELRAELDGSTTYDEYVRTGAGHRWIAWRAAPVPNAQGQAMLRQSVGRDITARKSAEAALGLAREKAEAANSAKSRFLATVSHEIRTPLNGIMGMADLMLDTKLSPEQRAYVGAVKSSGETLLSLIDEILDFSKIEAGRLDLSPAAFDLIPLVEGVAELLAPRAHAKGLELVVGIAPDLPRRLIADATRFRQVLMNLTGNAVKFTDHGGVALTLHQDAGSLVIRVQDTGPGIAADDLKRIFAEFEQGETTYARRHAGTGLGLPITRRIVEHMGGALTVETKLGKGSVFTATVGLVPADETPAPVERLDGLNILIVSSGSVEAVVLGRRLKARGATVSRAVDVDSLPTEGRFDCVLLDQRLGDETLNTVVARLKDRCDRLVLVVTPAARGEVARWREHGVNGWLVSPVREASLVMQVRPSSPGIASGDPLTDQAPEARILPATRPLTVLLAED